jgi:hypothetical protein
MQISPPVALKEGGGRARRCRHHRRFLGRGVGGPAEFATSDSTVDLLLYDGAASSSSELFGPRFCRGSECNPLSLMD